MGRVLPARRHRRAGARAGGAVRRARRRAAPDRAGAAHRAAARPAHAPPRAPPTRARRARSTWSSPTPTCTTPTPALRGEPAAARMTQAARAACDWSMSLFVLYFGTDRSYRDEVAHHTVLFGPRYRGLLDDIFHGARAARRLQPLPARADVTDPSLAPPGCDSFYVLSPVPHLGQRAARLGARSRRATPTASSRRSSACCPTCASTSWSRRWLTPPTFATSCARYQGSAFCCAPTLTPERVVSPAQPRRAHPGPVPRRRRHPPGRGRARRDQLRQGDGQRRSCEDFAVMSARIDSSAAEVRARQTIAHALEELRARRRGCCPPRARRMPRCCTRGAAAPTTRSTSRRRADAAGARSPRCATELDDDLRARVPVDDPTCASRFSAVARARAIPRALPRRLLAGMAMDVAGARYAVAGRSAALLLPRRRHGGPDDVPRVRRARDDALAARGAPRHRDAADQHLPRRARGLAARPPVPARRAAGGVRRSGAAPLRACGVFPDRRGDRRRARHDRGAARPRRRLLPLGGRRPVRPVAALRVRGRAPRARSTPRSASELRTPAATRAPGARSCRRREEAARRSRCAARPTPRWPAAAARPRPERAHRAARARAAKPQPQTGNAAMSRLRPDSLAAAAAARGTARAKPGTRAVVLGGGIAGVAAATVLAERGVRVTCSSASPSSAAAPAASTHTLADGRAFRRWSAASTRSFASTTTCARCCARIDPELRMLRAVADYPMLGPGGAVAELSRAAAASAAAQLLKLALAHAVPRACAICARIDGRRRSRMLAFDRERTYAELDQHERARRISTRCAFRRSARRMLFDVFAHSFFNPESEMSAAELLMMFHFYFTGEPRRPGLRRRARADVDRALAALSNAGSRPRWRRRLRLGCPRHRSRAAAPAAATSSSTRRRPTRDLLVLALDVAGLQRRARDTGPALDARATRQVRSCAATPSVRRAAAVARPPARPGARRVRGHHRPRRPRQHLAATIAFRTRAPTGPRAPRRGRRAARLRAAPRADDEAALRADLIAGLHALIRKPRARAHRVRVPFGARRLPGVSAVRLCRSADAGDRAARPRARGRLRAHAVPVRADGARGGFGHSGVERLCSRASACARADRSVPTQGLFAPIHAPRWARALGSSHAG